jgi:hypothetical protein
MYIHPDVRYTHHPLIVNNRFNANSGRTALDPTVLINIQNVKHSVGLATRFRKL